MIRLSSSHVVIFISGASFFTDNGNLYIEVLCGTSSMFEIKKVLSEEDKNQIKSNAAYFDELANQIRIEAMK